MGVPDGKGRITSVGVSVAGMAVRVGVIVGVEVAVDVAVAVGVAVGAAMNAVQDVNVAAKSKNRMTLQILACIIFLPLIFFIAMKNFLHRGFLPIPPSTSL
jgi:hypothetical protein